MLLAGEGCHGGGHFPSPLSHMLQLTLLIIYNLSLLEFIKKSVTEVTITHFVYIKLISPLGLTLNFLFGVEPSVLTNAIRKFSLLDGKRKKVIMIFVFSSQI